jgi:hypothetical protein
MDAIKIMFCIIIPLFFVIMPLFYVIKLNLIENVALLYACVSKHSHNSSYIWNYALISQYTAVTTAVVSHLIKHPYKPFTWMRTWPLRLFARVSARIVVRIESGKTRGNLQMKQGNLWFGHHTVYIEQNILRNGLSSIFGPSKVIASAFHLKKIMIIIKTNPQLQNTHDISSRINLHVKFVSKSQIR